MSGGALLEAAARGDAARVRSLLRADPAACAATDENGCSALQRAAADGHVAVLELLLQHGADPTAQDHVHGNTALHEAAWKGYSRCVAALAAVPAALRATNAAGFAPLHLACQNGHNQSTRELLLAGAPPDQQNNYGDTPLHTAARYGHAGVTRILVSAQCRVADQNKNGDTALHIAAAMARRKLTRLLLHAGCDKSLRNQQAETARDIAARKGLHEIIKILNTPVAKLPNKKEKRDKSRERTLDEVDDAAKKEKTKDKKKKNVHFEKPPPPEVQWSPYGCHYYPDPKYFPKPKLSSLPTEPLKKGEQYYLDLAGNIKKGPIGAGYTCYCAPFFKHMEDKMNEDKKDIKQHIDRAHERFDQKVTDLEMKTQGQISELTRFVAAERALCRQRHEHLELWLTRAAPARASERRAPAPAAPAPAPLQRTRSLDLVDRCSAVRHLIQSFNRDADYYETDANQLTDTKATSRSTELLDSGRSTCSPRRSFLKSAGSGDRLASSPSRSSRSPRSLVNSTPMRDTGQHNVTADVHVRSNGEFGSDRYSSPSRQSNVKSPAGSSRRSDYRTSESEADNARPASGAASPPSDNNWKSHVLQRTAEDMKKRVELEKEMSQVLARNDTKSMDISQDGYVKLRKQGNYQEGSRVEREPRRSVQELVAQVEHHSRSKSPEPVPVFRNLPPTETNEPPTPMLPQPSHSILKMSQQPQRPAPVLKDKPPKTKRFSLHNLIPFPTRKTFHPPPKDNGNNSESSDEEDAPIRSTNQPGPMSNSNLLQTLPMPNYETMSSHSQSPAPQLMNAAYPQDLRSMVPKDAYFHELPNRPVQSQMAYRDLLDKQLPAPQYKCQYEYEPGLPLQCRSRTPLYQQQLGVFDAMMQDHVLREADRGPQRYSGHLDQNTELEIANHNGHYHGNYYDNRPPVYPNYRGMKKPAPDHSLLHSRLQSLAINTHLTETQSQADRESHNDSGYSTKVYGSSQGPSPSLSGRVGSSDNLSGQRIQLINGKATGQIGASSLV